MRFSQRFALRAGAVGVAAAAIIVPATGAFGGTGPTLAATPNADLHEGDSVSVTGSGFTASVPYSLVQCSGTAGPADCDIPNATGGATDASGDFTNTYTVHTGTIGSGKCKPGSTNCFLAASTDNGGADTAIAPLSFAPFPSITVKPSKGIHDGDKVKVTGKDFPANKPVAVTSCTTKTDPTTCDTTNADLTQMTDGSGSFTLAKFTIHTTASGGMCKPGGKCFVAATTDIPTGADKSQDAATRIKLVPVATKTSAKLSKTSRIVGKVKAGNKGVAGLKVLLDRRKHGHWKNVDAFKTHKGGKFHSAKLHKSGKYEVKTPKQNKHGTSYGASHSKPIHV